ncbi:Hypothetical predicted protein, partial [Paramuricea clavata]
SGQDYPVTNDDIQVLFFYDSEEIFNTRGVTCRVTGMSPLWSVNVGSSTDPEGAESDNEASLKRLDFIILTIGFPENEEKKKSLNLLSPLFLDETPKVQRDDPSSKTRLCIIGHPHGAYKHIAFGELSSDPERLWREWKRVENKYGVEHTVATCRGSSGSPVIRFDILKNNSLFTGPYAICLPFFPFLHFQGASNFGDAVSGQSILPETRKLLKKRD